jgi:hypothetical protein
MDAGAGAVDWNCKGEFGRLRKRSEFLRCAAHKGVSHFGRNDGFVWVVEEDKQRQVQPQVV